MRLNVFLQQAGVGSRREAERMVAAGRVTINGVVAAPTQPVEAGDAVAVDGKPVGLDTRPLPRLFRLHKPVDVLVTNLDPQGRPTIFDMPVLKPPLWGADMPRVMYVGRLDVNSEGLLLLSSDGPLAQMMMSPDTALERTYRVRINGRLSPGQLLQIRRGVTADGVTYRGAKIKELETEDGNTWYSVILTEGKNREIRKLMDYFRYTVNRLIRLQYGPFKLDDLGPGAIAEVPPDEVRALLDVLPKKSP